MLKYLYTSIIITGIIILIDIILIPNVLAQTTTNNTICILNDSYKNHFPFDLVYPTNDTLSSLNNGYFDQCSNFSIFGYSYEFCIFSQITQIAKDIFLARFVIDSILHI